MRSIKVIFFLAVLSSCTSNNDHSDMSIIGKWDLSMATLIGINCTSPLGISTFVKGETRCLDTGPELLCPGSYWIFEEDDSFTIEYYFFTPGGEEMIQGAEVLSYSITDRSLTLCDDSGVCDSGTYSISDDQLFVTFTEDCAAEMVFTRMN